LSRHLLDLNALLALLDPRFSIPSIWLDLPC